MHGYSIKFPVNSQEQRQPTLARRPYKLALPTFRQVWCMLYPRAQNYHFFKCTVLPNLLPPSLQFIFISSAYTGPTSAKTNKNVQMLFSIMDPIPSWQNR